MTVELPGLTGGAGAAVGPLDRLLRGSPLTSVPSSMRQRRAQGGSGAGGQSRGLGFGLGEGGEQGVVVGEFGVAGEEVGAAGAGCAGRDGGVDQFAGPGRLVQDRRRLPSEARKSVRLPLRSILRTEISPVVTSPGPIPGVAWTAAITARSFTATAAGRPSRSLRSLLTEKPSLAASLGTFWVAVPLTLTVRSAATAPPAEAAPAPGGKQDRRAAVHLSSATRQAGRLLRRRCGGCCVGRGCGPAGSGAGRSWGRRRT